MSVHNIALYIIISYSDLLTPQDTSHQDWNGGVPGQNSDSGLASLDPCPEAETEAGSDLSNCDLKETSSGDNSSRGDPVAKAIEQRSYR